MQLDNRARTLLKALVERYIADGQPVGSRALSKLSGLELSPVTIRTYREEGRIVNLLVLGTPPAANGTR